MQSFLCAPDPEPGGNNTVPWGKGSPLGGIIGAGAGVGVANGVVPAGG
jgi:hypothetical protein